MDTGLEIKQVNPLDYDRWDELVLKFENYTFFHSSAWARVLKEAYGYQPVAFLISDATKILAVISMMEVNSFVTGRRGVALPFTDFCEPLVLDKDVLPKILKESLAYGREKRWKYLEVRGGMSCLEHLPGFEKYCHHYIDLNKKDEQMIQGFRSSTKRNIKKAINEGVEVEILNTFESLETFYRLHCETRRRHGLPPQPFRFFQKVYGFIVSEKKGFVAIGKWRGQPIAASVYFHFGEKAVYKYGASDFDHQKLRANNLIMWEAIKWCLERGLKQFSFGRTESENEGLMQFKRGWGVVEEIMPYYRIDPINGEVQAGSRKQSSYGKYMERLPLCVLKAIGSAMYRHVA